QKLSIFEVDIGMNTILSEFYDLQTSNKSRTTIHERLFDKSVKTDTALKQETEDKFKAFKDDYGLDDLDKKLGKIKKTRV
ncbi:hypothetical protein CU098_005883, partial [Rhizopus stolonifer]